MACAKQQYVASLGAVQIATANPNTDGTGAMGTVITGGSDGTLINTITIKAAQSTSLGMVRLFIDNGAGSVNLFQEVNVPAATATGVEPAFGISMATGFTLQSGYSLKASTQNAETFNVFADGNEWSNCPC